MESSEINKLIELAVGGNSAALEKLLLEVQHMAFNLALRMLGTVADAEDATQEILIRIMTNLSSFRKESNYSTWVYRIAVNYLINYKKGMFSHYPLSFDYYGNDISAGTIDNTEELLDGIAREELAQELKMSCTNVMLQCLDSESRCIFILGTMFRVDSRIAGEILEMKPGNYRQKLSRIRRKMAGFMAYYCGLTDTGFCSCEERIGYAIAHNRINPQKLEYIRMDKYEKDVLLSCQKEMEALDDIAMTFEDLRVFYQSPVNIKKFIDDLLKSPHMIAIQEL